MFAFNSQGYLVREASVSPALDDVVMINPGIVLLEALEENLIRELQQVSIDKNVIARCVRTILLYIREHYFDELKTTLNARIKTLPGGKLHPDRETKHLDEYFDNFKNMEAVGFVDRVTDIFIQLMAVPVLIDSFGVNLPKKIVSLLYSSYFFGVEKLLQEKGGSMLIKQGLEGLNVGDHVVLEAAPITQPVLFHNIPQCTAIKSRVTIPVDNTLIYIEALCQKMYEAWVTIIVNSPIPIPGYNYEDMVWVFDERAFVSVMAQYCVRMGLSEEDLRMEIGVSLVNKDHFLRIKALSQHINQTEDRMSVVSRRQATLMPEREPHLQFLYQKHYEDIITQAVQEKRVKMLWAVGRGEDVVPVLIADCLEKNHSDEETQRWTYHYLSSEEEFLKRKEELGFFDVEQKSSDDAKQNRAVLRF